MYYVAKRESGYIIISFVIMYHPCFSCWWCSLLPEKQVERETIQFMKVLCNSLWYSLLLRKPPNELFRPAVEENTLLFLSWDNRGVGVWSWLKNRVEIGPEFNESLFISPLLLSFFRFLKRCLFCESLGSHTLLVSQYPLTTMNRFSLFFYFIVYVIFSTQSCRNLCSL